MGERAPAYLAIGCVIPPGADDDLADRLGGLGILGTLLGPEGPGGVPVTVYLTEGAASLEPTLRSIVEDLGGTVVAAVPVESQDWLERYRREVRPFEVGRRWWLDPHPQQPSPAPAGRFRLTVEPRTAFGSGSHESTQLVLLELEAFPPCDLSVLDVGTGSGILALAAERLGARHVVGFDIDLGAVFVARQICGQQEWQSTVRLLAGPILAIGGGRFDLVLCNMVWEHSRPMVAELARVLHAQGIIVFSGLLASERGEIVANLERAGLAVAGERILGEWLSLRVCRG